MKNYKQLVWLSLTSFAVISAGLTSMNVAQAKPPSRAPAWGYRSHNGENINRPGKHSSNRVNRTNERQEIDNDNERYETDENTDNERNERAYSKKPNRQDQRNQNATGAQGKKPKPNR
jgi:hypothetical protein